MRRLALVAVVLFVACAPTGSDPDAGSPDAGVSCEPGATSCIDADRVKCSDTGDAWVVEETCAAGCKNGTCGPCPCTEDAWTCEGDQVVRCTVSPCARTVVEVCESGCVAGTEGSPPVCRDCTCLPGYSSCVDGANRREYCTADCLELKSESCGALLCTESGVNAACGPAACACVPGSVDECSLDGKGHVTCDGNCGLYTRPCPGGCLLSNGAVVCRTCVPGAKSCDGNTLVVCNTDGMGTTRTPCPTTCASAEGVAACVD